MTVVNRHFDRAAELARRWKGQARPWENLAASLAAADLVVSTTGATAAGGHRRAVRRGRGVAVPAAAADSRPGRAPRFRARDRRSAQRVSLFDRRSASGLPSGTARRATGSCPRRMHIVEQETTRFMAEMRRHAVGPVIERLRQGWQKPKEEELQRLLNKLPELDDRAREEIRRSFDRLVNKLLHPPLESLRDESRRRRAARAVGRAGEAVSVEGLNCRPKGRTIHSMLDPQLSTGLPGLDRVLHGLMPGDNFVWQVESLADFTPFAKSFCEAALAEGKKLVYFRFADHEPLVPESLGADVHLLRGNEEFEPFVTEVHRVVQAAGRGDAFRLRLPFEPGRRVVQRPDARQLLHAHLPGRLASANRWPTSR